MLDLIEAADIYVTPYLNLAQITSGTLSYAVALGKPVVSTPYEHAAEIVSPGNGLLVDPGSSGPLAGAIARLLGDDMLRRSMARNAYALGRTMLWQRNVETSLAGFAGIRAAALLAPPTRAASREFASAL